MTAQNKLPLILPFVTYLEHLHESAQKGNGGSKAALATLRRGLGKSPGEATGMFRYVMPLLPENSHPGRERAYFTVASLFALHPMSTAADASMGTHFAALRSQNPQNAESLERRFTALLAAHPDDMQSHLRQAVTLLKSKDVAINWSRLLNDLANWSHPDWSEGIKTRWARDFWTPAA
jgi:CRISPR system Cascade subunit CasB